MKKWVNSEQVENWALSMSSPQVVDWLKCIICQKETAEKTQCPANSKRYDSGAGYLTIERDLTSFHEAGELHSAVDWKIWTKEMEFLIHLKIIVPRGINLVGISLTKRKWTAC